MSPQVVAEIIIAIVAGISGLAIAAVPAYLTYRIKSREVRQEHAAAMRELDVQQAALGFDGFLSEWGTIHQELQALIHETPIDRFLILRAWNGEMTPKWTTAIFQFREGEQAPVSYVHFELDDDYVERLRHIASRSEAVLEVAHLPPSAIKSVYEMEGVKHSVWMHITTKKVEGSKSVAMTYCSFATHEDVALDDDTLTRCRLLVNRLKAICQ